MIVSLKRQHLPTKYILSADLSIAAAELLVDDFTYFKFPEFTAGFIADLKYELRLLLQHARKPFNWADVPGAADYDARRKAQLAEKSAASWHHHHHRRP